MIWNNVKILNLGATSVLLLVGGSQAVAQSATGQSPRGTVTTLPSVVVSAPKDQKRARTVRSARPNVSRTSRSRSANRTETESKPVAGSNGRGETAWGPVNGYVATRSATGTKTDTPLIETPQSISVISRDQMRDQGVQSVGDALRYTPGVVAEEYGGTDLRIDQYMVRGFSNTMPFVDGLTTNTRYTLLSPKIDPYGLERVEVVRGPSSVLYGQNIPGGLVNLISKRPTATPFNEIEVQGLSPTGVETRFDFGGPATKDGTWLYRMTGVVHDSQTQVDHVDNKKYYLAPSVTYAPSTDTTFTVLANVQHSEDGFLAQNLPAVGTLYPAAFGKIPTNFFIGEPGFNGVNKTSASIGYNFEHRFDDVWTARQNLRYSEADVDIKQVGTAGYLDATTLNRFTLGANAHLENFAIDNQLQAQFNTFGLQHTAVFGLDYFRSKDRWREKDGDAAPLDVTNPVYGQPYTLLYPYNTDDKLEQVGLYAQDQIKWGRFVLTGGIRHDWAQSTVVDSTSLPATVTDQRDKAVTGRAGLVYLFDNGLAPYFSYSTSFQPTIGSNNLGEPFKPTTGEQYEVGVKYQPVGSKSFIMLSAFNIDQANVLTADPSVGNVYGQVQTGGIRVRGFEASVTSDLGDGLKLIASYSYLDPKITADNSGDIGNKPADVPNHIASIWVDKTLQDGPLRGLGFGGGLRYVGERYGDNDNQFLIPGNFLVDSTVHYDYRNWRFAVIAKNLFDKTYVATCGNENFCYYGLRRSVIGSVTYRW